jgi:hypothetical protein
MKITKVIDFSLLMMDKLVNKCSNKNLRGITYQIKKSNINRRQNKSRNNLNPKFRIIRFNKSSSK